LCGKLQGNLQSGISPQGQDGQREKLFCGLFFWGWGLVALLCFGAEIESITCSFDKTLDRLTLKQRNSLSLPTGFIEGSLLGT